jgi:deazaflavin-dependent oxidoreductase (nitroreductase family)
MIESYQRKHRLEALMNRSRLVTITHATGPLALRIARTGVIPVWGVVRHRGRRSGKWYATAIAVRPTADGFLLPLPWGEGTDWCRNLRAAGGGIVHWGGVDYDVMAPEIIDAAAALPAFSALLRPLVRLFGIEKFLRVRTQRA